MTFARYFKASSYCLIAAGFMAIAATGAMDWVSIVLFSSVLAVSWLLDTVRIRESIPARVLNGLAFAYLPFFAVDYIILSRSFGVSMIHLMLFMSALKLLTLSMDRDYFLLYLISFGELLAASTLTVNIVFGACFLAFLFFGIATLVLFEMRRSNARMQIQGRVQPLVAPKDLQGTGLELFSPFPARLLSGTLIGITLLVLALSVPLFFLLPRVNLGLYRPPSGNTQFISGFSERVELGQIGTIKQSDALVMRVRTAQPASQLPADLKWRGIAFDYYDGRSWRRTDPRRRPVSTQGWYYKLEDSTQGTDWINQTFFIEALSTDVVFAAHKALAVSRDVGALQRDSAESLYAARHLQKKLRYRVISDPVRPDPVNISDLLPIPEEILDAYLQLPSRNPRISDLAQKATKEAPTKYAKARALELYLRSHYAYSLELRGTPNSEDPLAMFLFDIRRGHCEYFASAMTIMLRHLGIPARLVNGFRAGEYNSIGKNFIVRQYNAHSWVEAYFPPYGWVEFDPTPADPQHPRAAFTRWLSNLSDAIDLWWWEGIVNYDSSKQYQMMSDLRSGMERFRGTLKNLVTLSLEKGRREMAWLHSPDPVSALLKRWIVWIPWIPVAALLLVRPWRRRLSGLIRRILYRNNARFIAGSFYTEALDLLGARGMKKARGETPLEFAQNLANHPAGIPFMALTRMYNANRFGPPGVHFHFAEAQAQLRLLRNSLRKQ